MSVRPLTWALTTSTHHEGEGSLNRMSPKRQNPGRNAHSLHSDCFEPTITNEGRPAHGHFYELNSSLDFGTWTIWRTLLREILQTKSSLPHSPSKWCPSLLITRSWLSLAGFSCHIISGRHLALAATMGLSSHCFSCLNTHNGSCVCEREWETSKHAWNTKPVMFHLLHCQHE